MPLREMSREMKQRDSTLWLDVKDNALNKGCKDLFSAKKYSAAFSHHIKPDLDAMRLACGEYEY